MKIPKIKLVPQPETGEAKAAVGYQWNKLPAQDTFWVEHRTAFRRPTIRSAAFAKTMTFYAQVDSIGDEFDLADCMVIHNFILF
jgi:hypothetical protein